LAAVKRRLHLLLGLTVLLGLFAAGTGTAAAKPSCAAFVPKETILKLDGGEPVELTKPNSRSAVGDWFYGPRTACFAIEPGLPPGVLPETYATWGVGYGVTAKQWNQMKSIEGGINSVEGTGPWTRQPAQVGSGSHAFFATTTALIEAGQEPNHFLYLLTRHGNLLYLNISTATEPQLVAVARKALSDHPSF
jgi:hypothetical protein